MEDIIAPIDKELLKGELTKDKFLRYTNFAGNELYIVTHHDSPHILKEIGRLREISFRTAGGGTGKSCDLDKYDLAEKPYKQLIVWSPEHEEIVGGYRFFDCKDIQGDDFDKYVSTGPLFHFSEKFKTDYLPYLLELGRSFVQPSYQSTGKARIGIYALDNLWDGLGAIVKNLPHVKYFFGKVTMYTSYNQEARNILLYYMRKYYGDEEELLTPKEPLVIDFDKDRFEQILHTNDPKKDYKLLQQEIRRLGENIPPLINSYINLSPTLKSFGTIINTHFGDVEETAILVTLKDLYDSKSERYFSTFNFDEQGYSFDQ